MLNLDGIVESFSTPFDVAVMLSNGPGNFSISKTLSQQISSGSVKRLVLLADKKELGRLLTEVLLTKNPVVGLCFLEDTGILPLVLPELSRCKRIKQNPKYHIDNVFEHCIKTASHVEATPTMRWAGLLHDVGKFYAFSSKEGGASFHKHEVFSTSTAKKIFERLHIDSEIAEPAIFLISMHMYHYSSEWTDKTLQRFISKVGITEADIHRISNIPLFKLRMADRKSRDLDPHTSKQKDFEDRIARFVSSRIVSTKAEDDVFALAIPPAPPEDGIGK